MAKELWKPATLLNPVPVVLVTVGDGKGKDNIITIAWAGTINSEPPMVSISVRKERYSHLLLKKNPEFVVNLPTKQLARATDYCGVRTGAKVDKFKEQNLTKEKAKMVNIPLIMECPINIECAVQEVVELGSHDLFIGKILAINVDEKLISKSGKLLMDKANLICYRHGEYVELGKTIGYFGFSVASKKISR